jgi:prolyl-tRNA editing enzyme YbaK/EbsC (Cys-tRNA(Pro) deacylase)
MACKACNSQNLQRLDGELTASLPSLKALKVPPIYVCQSVVVCLDCGFAEFVIPTRELLSLKNAKAASGS